MKNQRVRVRSIGKKTSSTAMAIRRGSCSHSAATAAEGRRLRWGTSYPKSYPTSPSVDGKLPQFTNWIPGSSQGRRPYRAPPVLTGSDHDRSLWVHPPATATTGDEAAEAANATGDYLGLQGGQSRSVPHQSIRFLSVPLTCTSATASRSSDNETERKYSDFSLRLSDEGSTLKIRDATSGRELKKKAHEQEIEKTTIIKSNGIYISTIIFVSWDEKCVNNTR